MGLLLRNLLLYLLTNLDISFFRYVILCIQSIKFSIFDWTHTESNDPYEQEPLGTCEATLAEIVARGGDSQVD